MPDRGEEARLLEAGLTVAEARYVVAHNLDRHWRNARTIANHNPRAHKAAAVGAYLLTGEEPAVTGFF